MTIEDIKSAVKAVALEFPIKRTVLFGSRANGTFTEKSDVDLIMEFSQPITLITIALITEQLESALGTSVDVIHGPIQNGDMLEIDTEVEIYVA